MKETFRRFSARISTAAGSAYAFILAFSIVIFWAFTGIPFKFSNTWQLFINTTTTIGTFLMVFLIQNTQNRETKATQLKLDELIRATSARDSFIDIEDLTDDELEVINQGFMKLHEQIAHPAIHKLHRKIQDAHKRRKALRG
jgi:low affinity Fe/Cu permease